LGSLAAQNLIESGGSIKSSLKDATKTKFEAIKDKFRETFDPMNMISKLMPKTLGINKLLTAAYGRKFGRSAKDIEYFSGVKVPTIPHQEEPETPSQKPLIPNTKVSRGGGKNPNKKTATPVKYGKGKDPTPIFSAMLQSLQNIEGALLQQTKIIEKEDEDKKKEDELKKDFEKEKENEAKRGGLVSRVKDKIKDKFETVKEKGSGFLDTILKEFMPMVSKFMGGLVSLLEPLISALLPVLAVAGAAFAGFKIGEWINKNTKIQEHIATAIDSVKGWFGNSDADKAKESNKVAWQNKLDEHRKKGEKITSAQAKNYREAGVDVKSEEIMTTEEEISDKEKRKVITPEQADSERSKKLKMDPKIAKEWEARGVKLDPKIIRTPEEQALIEQNNTASPITSSTNNSSTNVSSVSPITNVNNQKLANDSLSLSNLSNTTNIPASPTIGNKLSSVSSQASDLAQQRSSTPIIVNAPTNNVVNSTGGGSVGAGGPIKVRSDEPVLLRVQYGTVGAF
jgi:hypothetical protein